MKRVLIALAIWVLMASSMLFIGAVAIAEDPCTMHMCAPQCNTCISRNCTIDGWLSWVETARWTMIGVGGITFCCHRYVAHAYGVSCQIYPFDDCTATAYTINVGQCEPM